MLFYSSGILIFLCPLLRVLDLLPRIVRRVLYQLDFVAVHENDRWNSGIIIIERHSNVVSVCRFWGLTKKRKEEEMPIDLFTVWKEKVVRGVSSLLSRIVVVVFFFAQSTKNPIWEEIRIGRGFIFSKVKFGYHYQINLAKVYMLLFIPED